MKSILLDTSFIIAAVAKKIDFFEMLEAEGFNVLIPQQVINELEGLGENLALNILEKEKFDLVSIPGKDADAAIVNFAKKDPKAVVATLDKGLQKRVKNSKIIIRGRKKLEIL